MPTGEFVNRYIWGNNTANGWTTTTTNQWVATTTWTPATTGNKRWNDMLRDELNRAYDWRIIDYTKDHIEAEEFADDAVENKPEECKPEESQLPDFGEDFDEMVLTI